MTRQSPAGPSHRLSRLLAHTALALGLAATATAALAQGQVFPPLPTPVPVPYEDAFYTPPPQTSLNAASPGAVLRYREISAKAYYLFPVKGQAWQLMYRSTDHNGLPIAMVGTILVPDNAPASQRQLMSYNVAYDALTLKCAPSYSFARGTALEQVLIRQALRKGMVVVSSDYEGLGSYWTVGRLAGQGALDGIRAAQNFAQAGLDGPATPVVITGYSGGSIAATWANELYRSYAPELNIKGVAAGGVPVDLGNVARKVDGKLFSGVYFAAVAALAKAYPEVDTDALTNDKGKAMLAKSQDMCLGQFLTGQPDPLTGFAFQKMKNNITVPDLLQVPIIQRVIAQNRLGQGTPGAPAYIYQGTLDEMMPIGDVDALVNQYCRQGVKLVYKRTFNDHLLLAVSGYGKAFDFLQDRLNGVPFKSTCR